MSQGAPRHPMKGKKPPSMSERLSGGELWDKPTKPDAKLERLEYVRANPGVSGPRWKRDNKGNLVLNDQGRPYVDPDWDGKSDYTERYDLSDRSGATPPAEVVDLYAEQGRNRFNALRAQEHREQEARRYGVQVRDMFMRAVRQGIDLPDEARQLEAILESGKRKLKSAA